MSRAEGRLELPFGSLIDRDKSLTFSFDGKNYRGYAGDSVASALAANGQWLLSRSFKYHRPRGVMTMAGQDANTLVQLPSAPNVLADRTPVQQGIVVSPLNVHGSLHKDRGRWLGRLAGFLPVGFYYKAFYKPRGIWEYWARFFRRMAGLGTIDVDHQPPRFDKQHLFCDVLVAGGGAAGIEAALSAAEQKQNVILIDENPVPGGALHYARFDVEGVKAAQVRKKLLARLDDASSVRVYTNATCNGWFADNWVSVIQGERMYKVRARQVIMACGVIEQPAIFHNNDLPGIMMSSAAQRLMRLYGVRPGRQAVIVTANSDGYATALDMLDVGISLQAIVDLREKASTNEMHAAVIERGVRVIYGAAVYAAQANQQGTHLQSVDIRRLTSAGQCAATGENIECDVLCVACGFMPAWQLPCQAGGALNYADETARFSITNLPDNVTIAGALNGMWSLGAARKDGCYAAARSAERLTTIASGLPAVSDSTESPNHPWPVFAHDKGKEFVDFDEDLQIVDLENATRDGYEDIQLVKRYSTCGMGPSQGRTSALAAARIVANVTGKSVAQTGVTTARPPVAAETLGHSAGRAWFPERRSNMHYRHVEAGATFLQAGAWLRPAFYGPSEQKSDCIDSEVRQVRENAGMVDVSTLGGLDIRGPDCAELLNRLYTGGFKKLTVGKSRYALMTNEAGVVIDDGVACRIQDQHFYVTATTGGVDAVYRSMLKWNAQWRLNVDIANVTSAYCGVNVAGPNSRAILEKVCPDVDLDAGAFPYMGVREGTVAGIPVRLLRVGFVGELGFEIHAPQHCGEALWDALMEAGKDHQMRPFGIEAQRVLRLEKGHIIIGQDTDAMSNPMELQMRWAVSKVKPFFNGGRTLQELDQRPLARVLAGFEINSETALLPLENQLVLDHEKMIGRVTSCVRSTTLGKIIGLAYVPPEFAVTGKCITIKCSGGLRTTATVSATPFYDPDNTRQSL